VLVRERYKLQLEGVQSVVFNEPANAMGFSAFCTEPIEANDIRRYAFRNYRLWKGPYQTETSTN
jgi:hypothetical protein